MTSLGSVRNISNYLHPLRSALYVDLRVRAGGRGVVRGCVFHRGLGSYLEVRIIHSHKVFTVVPLTPFFQNRVEIGPPSLLRPVAHICGMFATIAFRICAN